MSGKQYTTLRNVQINLLKAGTVGLLSGCLWLSTPILLAQSGDLQASVTNAIAQDNALKGQQITASVANGQVTLTGTVQTNAQRQEAETAAVSVAGVSGIANNLKVTDPNSPMPTANSDAQQANTLSSEEQAPPPPDEANVQQSTAPQPPADAGAQASYPQSQTGSQAGSQTGYQQGYTQSAQQPAYPQSYTGQNSYTQAPPPPQPPSGPVTIPQGTLLRIRLSEPIDTSNVKTGAYFQATAAADVYQGGVLAIPRGAVLTGQVVEAKKGGELGGSAKLQLNLTSLNLEGRSYPLVTDLWDNKGPNKAGYTAANTVGGAAVGALIGGIIGRGAGAAIGAGVGGAAGLGASAATNGPRLILPVETQLDFHLTAPITVQPVSWQEAQRLATASQPQQPRLVRRPAYYPYGGYPPPPPPPGYVYPY
ncbi:BON domain-containing protein [Silvibacterium sp.]|uniref:BON domain-containing protein n=1 Tax=Silvibacterium sp. TaxID=1964179 RepID=UPI0039E35B5A